MTAKKAAKASTAKTTSASNTAARKTAAKKAPKAMPAAQPATPRFDGRMAAMLGLVFLLGAGLALVLPSQQSAGTDEAEIKAMIRDYIAENPRFILETLSQHTRDAQQEARNQAINLVKSNTGTTVLGNPDGDVTIYEFSDYNCGYCKRSFADLMALIESDGNIRLVIKEFPILSQSSEIAARFALAAGELGKFPEFHTAMMTWQGPITAEALEQVIAEIGIDFSEIQQLAADPTIDGILQETRSLAQQLEINGTPGFIIGNTLMPGAISREVMEKMVRETRAANG